jgi:hypothetical protein
MNHTSNNLSTAKEQDRIQFALQYIGTNGNCSITASLYFTPAAGIGLGTCIKELAVSDTCVSGSESAAIVTTPHTAMVALLIIAFICRY